MSKKFLLQSPRLGTSPPAVGVGHALNNWAFGRGVSYEFNMEWVVGNFEPLDINKAGNNIDRGGHTPQMFLDHFGLNNMVQNKKFNEIKRKYNLCEVPKELKNATEIKKYISEKYKHYDGVLLPFSPPTAISSKDVTNKIRKWFKDRKGENKKSLCSGRHFNICIPIRRGDRVFMPNRRDEKDSWFLNKLEQEFKKIDSTKAIKVFIFSETYNNTWWNESQLSNTAHHKWEMSDIHPKGHWLVNDFKNKNFNKIEKIYVNHEGEPVDLEKMFSKYNAKLYLNGDIYTVLDSILDADLIVRNGTCHGTGSLVDIFKETII